MYQEGAPARFAADESKAEDMLDPTCPGICVLCTYVLLIAKKGSGVVKSFFERNIVFAMSMVITVLSGSR
jgi:hypothetical protein